MSTPPVISVVIASIVGAPFIDDCLASVFAQKNAPPFEVIVVDCRGPENVGRLRQQFPDVRFVELDHRETVPQLAASGWNKRRAELSPSSKSIAWRQKNWLATLVSAFSPQYVAVGGPIEFRGGRLRDWITYFIEYNSYLPAMARGRRTKARRC